MMKYKINQHSIFLAQYSAFFYPNPIWRLKPPEGVGIKKIPPLDDGIAVGYWL
jgi:hypothetical protein